MVVWSPTMGLRRIFPVPNSCTKKIKRWNIIKAQVIRPNGDKDDDWRHESWKLKDSRDLKKSHKNIQKIGRISKQEAIKLIFRTIPTNGCSNYLNEKKVSLGLTIPVITDTYMDKGKYYVEYRCCEDCKTKSSHRQSVIEWGSYRLLQKGGNKSDLDKTLHMFDSSYIKWFLVGNQKHNPKSFIIISIFSWKLDNIVDALT